MHVENTPKNVKADSACNLYGTLEKIITELPQKTKKSQQGNILKADWIGTPLGPMYAIGDEEALYVLEFANPCRLKRGAARLLEKANSEVSTVSIGRASSVDSIEKELCRYFNGTLNSFSTPIKCIGSPFQKKVWLELTKIPTGETRSYFDIAKALGNPSAVRAVGGANGANCIAIVIPCHRVINANGKLGGYAGEVDRKKWLLEHESIMGRSNRIMSSKSTKSN